MCTYCLNNPVKFCDEKGASATVAGAILGGLFGLINGIVSGGSLEEVLSCAAVGAATGAAAGFVADVAVATLGVGAAIMVSAAAGGIASAVNSAASQSILNDGHVDPVKVIYDGAIGAVMGGLCTAAGSIGQPVAKGMKEGIRFVESLISTEITMASSLSFSSSLLFDIGTSAVTVFGGWLFGIVCDGYNNILRGK